MNQVGRDFRQQPATFDKKVDEIESTVTRKSKIGRCKSACNSVALMERVHIKVKKSSPKSLLTDCQATLYQQLTDS